MYQGFTRQLQAAHAARRRSTFARNESGATAIEFAVVSFPFIALLFGIMSVSLLFFTTFSIENAVWQASRDIRTGAFQNSKSSYSDPELWKAAFKTRVCARAPGFVDCTNKLRILVQAQTQFGQIQAPACRDGNGALIDEASARAAFDPGGASSVVLITACFEWAFGGKLPFIRVGNMANGSRLIQASSALRTEPYTSN
jgi:Flp pilus assembly protein TadG